MDAMTKRAFTLTELILVIVLSGILIIAVTPQFIMLVRLKMDMDDRVYTMREALIIMDHMSRVLRFAKPSTISFGNNQIQATIEGGHIGLTGTNDTDCYYKRSVSESGYEENGFYFAKESFPVTWCLIGSNVASFDTGWDPSSKLLVLRFTITKNNVSVPLETTIKVLGEG